MRALGLVTLLGSDDDLEGVLSSEGEGGLERRGRAQPVDVSGQQLGRGRGYSIARESFSTSFTYLSLVASLPFPETETVALSNPHDEAACAAPAANSARAGVKEWRNRIVAVWAACLLQLVAGASTSPGAAALMDSFRVRYELPIGARARHSGTLVRCLCDQHCVAALYMEGMVKATSMKTGMDIVGTIFC